jgi:S-formylglutathione hydrolase
MGGHGAISLYLRNPGMYRSASGFSAALNPLESAWGQKAFKGYLTNGIRDGKEYDSTELIQATTENVLNILIDYVRSDLSFSVSIIDVIV